MNTIGDGLEAFTRNNRLRGNFSLHAYKTNLLRVADNRRENGGFNIVVEKNI